MSVDCTTPLDIFAFAVLSPALAAEPPNNAAAPTARAIANFLIRALQLIVWNANLCVRTSFRHATIVRFGGCDILSAVRAPQSAFADQFLVRINPESLVF